MDNDKLSKALVGLVELVKRLRGPGGCPWDAEQTDSTVKIYLLEEAYEVLEAIERSSPQEVCLELGDLLFHIILLAQLAEEKEAFDLMEVVQKITEKMTYRHPHVFGETTVENAEEVVLNWARLKRAEKDTDRCASSLLENIPAALPALLRAHRLSERASRLCLYEVKAEGVLAEIEKEVRELGAAVGKKDISFSGQVIGRLLFNLSALARIMGENAEDLLRRTNQRFLERFGEMERTLRETGTGLEEATSEEIRHTWENTKIR